MSLPQPSLTDNTADADRLVAALRQELHTEAVAVDLDLLKRLPEAIRHWGYRVRCTVFRERGGWVLTGIDSAETPRPALGLAVDLGTTRVVLLLIDLSTGRPIAESAVDNPQIVIGPDVLTRIHHAETAGGLKELNDLVITGLNSARHAVCPCTNVSSWIGPISPAAKKPARGMALELPLPPPPGWPAD